MAILFLDSSALLKRYLRERGTAWVSGLLGPPAANSVFVARIAGVEVVSAIRRQERRGNASQADAASAIAQLRRDLGAEYRLIEITPALVAHAMSLADKHALRGYDAVQLAASLEVHRACAATGLSGCTLVSADLALNQAALAEGLRVEDPNAHP